MPVEIVRTDLVRLDETQLIALVERVNAIGVLFSEVRPLQDRLPTLFSRKTSSLAQRRGVGAKVTRDPPCRSLVDCSRSV
ncbi:MAG: hypothetical protein LC797_09095 [Chloroflexi bacterium]|nr:hypothetical protein [Chloroflexota bacterium]